jgi:hypothetical protein
VTDDSGRAPKSVTFNQNRWSRSVGISGQIHPEYARDAWCEQQSYAHVRETAELTAFVEEVDRAIEAPCN